MILNLKNTILLIIIISGFSFFLLNTYKLDLDYKNVNFKNEKKNTHINKILEIHPNIYKNGLVCISILHEGTDIYGYEKDIERWLPTHGINTIMISIISMLSSPNFESPANIDASTLWKNNPDKYKQEIYKMVSLSQN